MQRIELKLVTIMESRARSISVQELHNTLPTLSGIEDVRAPCAYIDSRAITYHDITGKGAHIREIGVRIDGKLVYTNNAREHVDDCSAYIPEKAFYLQWQEEGSSIENGKSIYSVLRSRAPNGQKLHYLFFHLNSELYQVTTHLPHIHIRPKQACCSTCTETITITSPLRQTDRPQELGSERRSYWILDLLASSNQR